MRKVTTIVSTLLVAALLPLAASGQTSKSSSTSKKTEVKKTVEKKKHVESKTERGSRIFGTHCASCHADGENTVTPRKPIKGSQVLATMATFKSYLNEPIGNMPHYEDVIKDEKVLGDLYSYVKTLDNGDSPPVEKGKSSKEKKS